jgi:hypothetical protein
MTAKTHMTLRIGFDMDGVLADFASAFQEVEVRLFGPGESLGAGQPEKEEEIETPTLHQTRRRRDAIWDAIRATRNFWTALKPTDEGAVRRIHELMLRHRWEVFFITQRPATEGDTVQRQTQQWLVEQGFDWPSVLVISGSRGAAAGALGLHYHVDDSPQNCIDVISESRARPILIAAEADAVTIASAKKLRIGTTRSIAETLDVLDQASAARGQPRLLERLASMIGWG